MGGKGSSFLTTFALMSRIRTPYNRQARFSGSLFYIPIIGFIVSVLLFGIYAGLSAIVPDPFVVVLVVLIFQYLLFNLFHYDGYLDTADAFLCFADREKRHAILQDSSTGAFALFFGTVYIGAKLYLLTKTGVYFYILGTDPLSRLALLFLFFSYPMTGRTAAALLPLASKPAKEGGLGAAMRQAKPFTAFFGLIAAHVPGAALYVAAYLLFSSVSLLFFFACGGALLSFIITAAAYNRKAGGYTGDAFGFAIETGEVLHMLIFYLLLTYGLG